MHGAKIMVIGAGQRSEGDGDPVGNGRAISLVCAREGAHVLCIDRDQASAECTAASIRESGGSAEAVEADVSQPEEISSLMHAAKELNGVVMNVGISPWAISLTGDGRELGRRDERQPSRSHVSDEGVVAVAAARRSDPADLLTCGRFRLRAATRLTRRPRQRFLR